MYEFKLSGVMCEDILKCMMGSIKKLLFISRNKSHSEEARDDFFDGFKTKVITYREIVNAMVEQGYPFRDYVAEQLEEWEKEFIS